MQPERTADAPDHLITPLKRVAVAFSGGVDSSYLLYRCLAVLGQDQVLPLYAETPLQTGRERQRAFQMCRELGGQLRVVPLNPLTLPEFVANPDNRCYVCKKWIYETFMEIIQKEGIPHLLDGTNFDDLSDHRPGLRALQELGIITPLADAGLTKQAIRELAQRAGLSNWNLFSASCLATRVITGETITRTKLDLVADCENYLQKIGLKGFRVRLHGSKVALELDGADFAEILRPEIRRNIVGHLQGLGIESVLLDLKERRNH